MSDCIFCKIVSGDIPSNKIYEDEQVIAFRDINPQAPTHILVVPKRHIPGVNELAEQDEALVGHVYGVIARLVRELGIAETGYRVVVIGEYYRVIRNGVYFPGNCRADVFYRVAACAVYLRHAAD